MSSYTMQLRTYIEMFSQTQNGLTTSQKIESGRTKLFDFNYPFFDETYKKVFETNFIRNFYMREIGFETEGLFKLHLENWLNINMPYFNKLFESELLKFDPLKNSEMNVSYTKTNDGTTTGTITGSASGSSNQDSFNRSLESNNPDSRLSITTQDGEGVIEYASRIDEIINKNTATGESTNSENSSNVINTTEDFIQNRVGKIGVQTYSKMLKEYRDSFLRIEKQIFDEMQQLFMLVY